VSTTYLELHNIQAFFSGFPSSLLSANTPLELKEASSKGSQRSKEAALSNRSQPVALTEEDGKIYSIDPLADSNTLFDGDRALRDIALAGSRWRRRHIRKADMEVRPRFAFTGDSLTPVTQVYVYRLMIEWAALVDPARKVPT
jgi:hypothetical protein